MIKKKKIKYNLEFHPNANYDFIDTAKKVVMKYTENLQNLLNSPIVNIECLLIFDLDNLHQFEDLKIYV